MKNPTKSLSDTEYVEYTMEKCEPMFRLFKLTEKQNIEIMSTIKKTRPLLDSLMDNIDEEDAILMYLLSNIVYEYYFMKSDELKDFFKENEL